MRKYIPLVLVAFSLMLGPGCSCRTPPEQLATGSMPITDGYATQAPTPTAAKTQVAKRTVAKKRTYSKSRSTVRKRTATAATTRKKTVRRSTGVRKAAQSAAPRKQTQESVPLIPLPLDETRIPPERLQ